MKDQTFDTRHSPNSQQVKNNPFAVKSRVDAFRCLSIMFRHHVYQMVRVWSVQMCVCDTFSIHMSESVSWFRHLFYYGMFLFVHSVECTTSSYLVQFPRVCMSPVCVR